MSKVIITPGATPLADWRATYEGASVALDAAAWQALETMFVVRQNTWSEVLQLDHAEFQTHLPIVAFEGGQA